jgi:hypothetical protein
MVLLKAEMIAKNPYWFLFGPTSRDGSLVISSDEIVDEADDQLRAAMMDYCPIEEAFAGGISARVADAACLEGAISHIGVLGEKTYPAGHRARLEEAVRRMEAKGIPHLDAEADGKNIAV